MDPVTPTHGSQVLDPSTNTCEAPPGGVATHLMHGKRAPYTYTVLWLGRGWRAPSPHIDPSTAPRPQGDQNGNKPIHKSHTKHNTYTNQTSQIQQEPPDPGTPHPFRDYQARGTVRPFGFTKQARRVVRPSMVNRGGGLQQGEHPKQKLRML